MFRDTKSGVFFGIINCRKALTKCKMRTNENFGDIFFLNILGNDESAVAIWSSVKKLELFVQDLSDLILTDLSNINDTFLRINCESILKHRHKGETNVIRYCLNHIDSDNCRLFAKLLNCFLESRYISYSYQIEISPEKLTDKSRLKILEELDLNIYDLFGIFDDRQSLTLLEIAVENGLEGLKRLLKPQQEFLEIIKPPTAIFRVV